MKMKEKDCYAIIGANILIYGHFDVYQVPDDDGRAIISERKVTKESFLRLLYDYYHFKTRSNDDFGNSLYDQNVMKRFILRRAGTEAKCELLGGEWVESMNWMSVI